MGLGSFEISAWITAASPDVNGDVPIGLPWITTSDFSNTIEMTCGISVASSCPIC